MAYQSSEPGDAAPHRSLPSRHRFVADLSQCLFDFVIQLLPTQEEMAVKEDVRKLLERLIRTIEPDSRLLSFGSTANGFSLRNSDMDLCCLIDASERLAAADLVTMLGDLLERETKFHVKPLPHARIPIVKLSLDPSPGLPLGIACDIGFENRLALENTRLLMCYAMVDPTRVRTMVLFLKVWSKRRKINSPYKGTLSSYGYVLLVIYFLVHVKNPPVLPNLQQMPPLRPITKEDTHLAGYNTWFFDDIELLRQRWGSDNNESVAELLIDFFRYYARDFSYNTGVASIRAGLIKKTAKGWQNDLSTSRYHDSRERNRLCIEDPFELDFNVGRCVTKDGLYTIRGEFMRASRILSNRPERAVVALAELCAERPDEDLISAPASSTSFVVAPPRPPPQTPYSVGSGSGSRPKAPVPVLGTAPANNGTNGHGNGSAISSGGAGASSLPAPPPEAHMAPRRSKWTSPPPPGAPADARALFESNLGLGLELATSSTDAREREQRARAASEAASSGTESNGEVFTDTDASVSDAGSDVVSVRSFTEGVAVRGGPMPDEGQANGWRRPSWHAHDTIRPMIHQNQQHQHQHQHQHLTADGYYGARGRNQRDRERERLGGLPPTAWSPSGSNDASPSSSRRSSSGPPRAAPLSFATFPPLPPSPENSSPLFPHLEAPHTVFYQTSPRPSPQSSPRTHTPLYPQYPAYLSNNAIIGMGAPSDVFPSNHPPLSSTSTLPESPTPVPNGSGPGPSWTRVVSQHVQTHSRSASTITNAPTPKPHAHAGFSQQQSSSLATAQPVDDEEDPSLEFSSATSSPTPSLSTGYETSVSMSPSPSPPLLTGSTVTGPKSPVPTAAPAAPPPYDAQTPRAEPGIALGEL
ncbi:hypothetical protein C8J57DRAFT_293187 [Mycena rebaudengoi]|nr:hypothetical protein C8J57DRAFT_293187 [Mycena rebaudengoi]